MMEELQEEFHYHFADFWKHDKSSHLFQDPFKCAPKEQLSEVQLELIDLQESSKTGGAF